MSAMRRSSAIALYAVIFASSAMMRVCDPMLTVLANEFSATTGQAAQTVSAYAIAYGLLQFFFGPAGDRWGKRRVVACGALATMAGNLLAAFAPNLLVLVVARMLSGAAASGIIALVLAWVGDTVPYERRQAALARFLTATLAGLIAGQLISGVLTEQFGWRAVFVLLIGLFGVSGTLILLDPAVNEDPRAAGPSPGHLQPVADVLRIPWARRILMVVCVEGALALGAIAFLPAYLVSEFKLGISSAAAIVGLYGVGGLAYALTASALVRRLGEAGLARLGGGLLATGWLTLALAHHWWLALPACTLAGLGFYALHGVLQTNATQMAPAMRGTAVCLFASALFIGVFAGVAAASMVVDRAGFRPVFGVGAVGLAALACVFAAVLKGHRNAG